MTSRMEAYLDTIAALGAATAVTDGDGCPLALEAAVDRMVEAVRGIAGTDGKVMVVGNGGSAAIASHMATDYSKNGGIRTQAFSDPALLTCLSNDYGYDQVFARAIGIYGHPGDLVIAISSSGQSPNILNAVRAAGTLGCRTVTFSGFTPTNPLRSMGGLNFYVDSQRYGFVELVHLALCHGVLDIAMGWVPDKRHMVAV